MVIEAPGGAQVTEETSGNWDTAGIIQKADGTWFIAAHGCSRASVYDRTHARYNRGHDYLAMHVGALREATAPVVRDYFRTHAVVISSLYSPGIHQGLSEHEVRGVLRVFGANSAHVDGTVLVARDHPGEEGHAGVWAAGAIASVSYADGKFAVKVPAGWRPVPGWVAGRWFLRRLAREGWTAVAFRQGDRVADFQVDQLLKSMNARTKAA
jgi:hypothetical protein